MTRPKGPSIVRAAHGEARRLGAELVVEAPPLDEVKPPNAAHTERGLERRKMRGRPFETGNAAAENRPPMLCRSVSSEASDEEVRRIMRRGETLRRRFVRELSVQVGDAKLTSDVLTEIRSWARCVAWAAAYEAKGEASKAMNSAERASAHHLRARGLAERGLQRPAPKTPAEAQADIRRRLLGEES